MLFRCLSPHADAAQLQSGDDDDSSFPNEVQRLRNNIPGILASLTGKAAHAALVELASEHAGTRLGAWLQGVVRDHASAEGGSKVAIYDRGRYTFVRHASRESWPTRPGCGEIVENAGLASSNPAAHRRKWGGDKNGGGARAGCMIRVKRAECAFP